jgi:hypothetical protein
MKIPAPVIVLQLLPVLRGTCDEFLNVGRVYPPGGELHDFHRVEDHPFLLALPEIGVFRGVGVTRPQRLADDSNRFGDFPRMAEHAKRVVQDVEPAVFFRPKDDQIVPSPRLLENAGPHGEVFRLRRKNQAAAVAEAD